MSEFDQGAADIPEAERLIGVDNLWPHDRQARAAYSGNPQFRDGAGFAPLAYRLGGGPLLARPDIAEALEQVHLYRQPGDAGEPDWITNVNADLALQGLEWLREHADEAPSLRLDVIDTKKHVHNSSGNQQAAAEALNTASSPEDDYERQRKAEEEAREAHQAEREAQIETVVEHVKNDRPDLDFESFLGLVETLHSSATPKGVHIAQYKGFPLRIRDQVLIFLDNPRRLINDMEVARHASAFIAPEERRHTYPIAAAYVDKIDYALTDTLRYGLHEDLSEEIVDEWFSAIDSAHEPEAAAAILSGTGVLQRSLSNIVREDPVRFIDRLHMLAMRGLDPAEELTSETAMNIIADCLRSDAMAACSLMQACFFVEDPEKVPIQQQAVDLVMTLEESGLPADQYYSDDMYGRLDRKEASLIERKLVPRLPHGGIDWKTWEARNGEQGVRSAKSAMSAFERKALTRNGRITTLYGRLRTHREKHSFNGRMRRVLGRQLKTLQELQQEEQKK